MMTRFLLLAAALVAAGCVGGDPVEPAARPPPSPTPSVEPEPAPAARWNVTTMNGSVAGAGNPGLGYVRAQGENVLSFDLPEGASALVVEVAWEGGAALDVRLDVPSSHCTAIDPLGVFEDCPSPAPDADGQSPARIEVTDAESLARAGEWRLGVWARASPSPVAFSAFVTVFHDGKPEPSYSAVPAG